MIKGVIHQEDIIILNIYDLMVEFQNSWRNANKIKVENGEIYNHSWRFLIVFYKLLIKFFGKKNQEIYKQHSQVGSPETNSDWEFMAG